MSTRDALFEIQKLHRDQSQKMITVRMDEAIHAALGKLRFSKEAPSVNKLAIWTVLDYIFRDETAFNTLMQGYGFETQDELIDYLSLVYGYAKEEPLEYGVKTLGTDQETTVETFTEEVGNVQSIA